MPIVVSLLQLVQENRPEKSRGYHCNVHITVTYHNISGSLIGIPDDATAEPVQELPSAVLLPQLFHDLCRPARLLTDLNTRVTFITENNIVL